MVGSLSLDSFFTGIQGVNDVVCITPCVYIIRDFLQICKMEYCLKKALRKKGKQPVNNAKGRK